MLIRQARPRPARPARRAAPLVALVLLLAGCGGGDPEVEPSDTAPPAEVPGEASPTSGDDRDPAQVVADAVGATLDADRLTISSQATLTVGEQSFAVFTDGPVRWSEGVADLRFGVQQEGERTEVRLLGDGTDAWVSVEGPDAPAFPDGATWVTTDAEDLVDASSFAPMEFLAAILALRAADDDVDEFEEETRDGVATRVFGTTVSYVDAVRAAGPDAEAFRTALSLTGDAEQSDLDIEVAVGPDDVIRTFDLTIDSTADVGGGYDIDLTDVDRDVAPPAAPGAADVAGGPRAEQLFAELVGS